MEPHIEVVFAEKVDDALVVIFNRLNRLEDNFDYHFKKINEYMGYEVTKEQKSLVRGEPSQKMLSPELAELLKSDQSQEMNDYRNWLKLKMHIKKDAMPKLKSHGDEFNKDWDYLMRYIQRTTLWNISHYIRESYEFFEKLEYDDINWFYLNNRRSFANRIIKYCEKHKIPRRGYDREFLKFKQRWK